MAVSAKVESDFTFIDDYRLDNDHSGRGIECLIHHIKGTKKYEDKVLKKALDSALIAIKILQPVDALKALSDSLNPDDYIKDEVREGVTLAFLAHPIDDAIDALKIRYVTGKKEINVTDQMLTNFSIRFFKRIDATKKSHFKHLFNLVPHAITFKILPVEEVLSLHKRLQPLFDEDVPSVPLNKPPQRETINVGSFLIPKELAGAMKVKFEKEQQEKEQFRKNQVDKLGLCLRRLAETYVPQLVPAKPVHQVDHISKDHFDDILPGVVTELFFADPRPIKSEDKKLILILLKKFDLFLDWNARRGDHLKDYKIDKNTIETQIYGLVTKCIHLSQEDTFKAKETFLDKLVVCISTNVIFRGLQFGLSPLTVLTIVDRLLNFPIDLSQSDSPLPPLENIVEDKAFNFEAGELLVEMIKKTILMGVPSETFSIWSLFKILEALKETLGGFLFYGVAKILATDCSMKPLLIATHILLDRDQPVFPPKELPKISIQERMNTNVYRVIHPWFKLKAGSTFAKAFESVTGLKPFLDTLGKKLDQILNDQFALNVLTFHLLNGAIEYIQWKKVNS